MKVGDEDMSTNSKLGTKKKIRLHGLKQKTCQLTGTKRLFNS